MKQMQFIPKLKEFLKANEVIYTVRKFRMQDEVVEVEGVGNCIREFLGQVRDHAELVPYLKLSGFGSLDAWWQKIDYFITDKRSPKYLYKVSILKE